MDNFVVGTLSLFIFSIIKNKPIALVIMKFRATSSILIFKYPNKIVDTRRMRLVNNEILVS